MLNRIRRRLKRTYQTLMTGSPEAIRSGEIPQITAEEIAQIKEFFPLEKFFIFGHARSGTTLLTRLIRLHEKVHCNYQAHFFTRPPLLSEMMRHPAYAEKMTLYGNHWNQGGDLRPVALRAMADFILEREAREVGKRIVGDKSPNVNMNGQAVIEMSRVYPDAKLIYIVRDGRDALVSHRFQNFIDHVRFLPPEDLRIRDDIAQNPEPYFNGEKSIFTPKAMQRMANGWVKNVQTTNQEGLTRYGDHYLSLRYEDLLQNPYAAISNVWRFLGVDPGGHQDLVRAEMEKNPDATWQRRQASDLAAVLEKGKRGSWKNLFTEKDKETFKGIAGPTLIEWGYEEGLDW